MKKVADTHYTMLTQVQQQLLRCTQQQLNKSQYFAVTSIAILT